MDPSRAIGHGTGGGYPESTDYPPSSRGSNHNPRDELLATSVKDTRRRLLLMCSFGGRIVKRPTDSSLCYLGGETRMVKIDRQASLADLRAMLSQYFAGGRLISLKYKIPGVHLDSLISIFTEEDLKIFISECDRAENAVVSRSRIRLFVFEAGKPEPISSVASLPVLSENTTTLHKNVAEQKERPSRTLFVRNISSNVEDSDLLALFGPFGDIHSLYTGTKHRGFIMISYFDIRNAQTAMNELQNKPLRRRNMDIYFTVPKEDSFNKDLDEGALVVSTIDPSLSSKEILQTFRAYGEVREIRDRPQETNNKFIVAEYYDTRAAHAARQSLICGETMKNESVFPDGMYMKYDFELESHQQGSGLKPQARRPDTSKYAYSELKSEDCLFSLEDDDHAQGSLDWSPPILFHCFKDHRHTSNTFGRDDIRESITTLIMSNINEDTLSVISIVAKSGAGKATLVRLIYQDRRVSDSFDKQMWIRMSDKFDARCLMIAILEQATQVQCDITDLHLLMEHVKAELTDKKFLLVLENCVLESQRFWSNALEYLNIGAKGSFIIITTPKETVSSVSRSMSFHLSPLQDVHCLQIFQQYTCDENRDPDRHRSLEKFSRTVRYKCGGNPLYLKAVCGLFCHSNSSLQLMDYFEKESLQDLELYYSVLPPHLKLCLQLCSLFPKEYVYSQQHLVQLWMSQGFINCGTEKLRILAPSISMSWSADHSLTVRHFIMIEMEGLHDFFQKFQSLKTLNLSFTFIDQLPASIGNLKHLQYLAVNNTDLKNLPSEICSLDELQTLEARNCCYLLTLPQNIMNLKKLRHLDVRKQPGRVRVPRGVGHLVHLKTLPVLNVGRDSSDCSILELRDLDNLCGDLVLTGLENVKAGDNCKEAKLINKKYLKNLTLEWSDNNENLEDDNDEIAAEVFQSLEPSSHLESLTVRNYSGSLFPVWIEKSPFDNLQSITLDSCYNCCMLPALGDLQSLRHLCLRKMYAPKTFGYTCSLSEEDNGGKFPALELLKLWEMYELDGWIGVKDGDFPRLHTVSIVGCPILKSLPRLPSLVDLFLHRCNQLPEIPELVKLKSLKIEGFQDMVSLDLPQRLPALKNLEIIRCNKLESLVDLSTLSSIERLKIVKCPNLDVVNKWQHHFKNIRTSSSRDATVISTLERNSAKSKRAP